MNLGLNQKMMTAGTLVLLIVFTILWFSNRSITQLSEDIELSKKMSQLDQLITLVREQSIQYGENAPRDYESYNRDLQVYFTGLQENLSTIDSLINNSAHSYYNRNSTTNLLIDGVLIEKNNQAFTQMELLHQTFKSGFNEQIGDNLAEPRLEWGNDYLLNDESGLFSQIATTHMNFEDLVSAQRQATVNFNWLTIGLIALLVVLMIVWFNQAIVKRIIRVAKACREVALGNYGLKIKDPNHDEIGQLVDDFNQLSGRSKSILSILNQLQQASTKQRALDVIRTETQSIVNVSNAYYLTPKKNSYAVEIISSSQSQKGLLGKTLVTDDSAIENIGSQSTVLISDVLSHTIQSQQAHFAKYLLNQVNANSILVLKLKQNSQQGLLLLTKNSKNGFNEEQIQTLESLTPLFASALLN
ncbi:MAG: HAMP domain-containing protein [Marinicella sp.]